MLSLLSVLLQPLLSQWRVVVSLCVYLRLGLPVWCPCWHHTCIPPVRRNVGVPGMLHHSVLYFCFLLRARCSPQSLAWLSGYLSCKGFFPVALILGCILELSCTDITVLVSRTLGEILTDFSVDKIGTGYNNCLADRAK